MAPKEITPGVVNVWHGGDLLFEIDATNRRCPSEGEFLRHHGTVYVVTRVVTFYSASLDGYDMNVAVEPVRVFQWVFNTTGEVEAAYKLAKERDMSDCAYIASACRLKSTIDPILAGDGDRADQLRKLLGIVVSGTGCGVIE